MKKSVLILSYSDLSTDPRVKKQIEALKDEYEVVTAGNAPPASDSLKFYPIRFKLQPSLTRKLYRLGLFLSKQHEKYYWDQSKLSFIQSVKKENFDLIIANDINTLPLACRLKKEETKIYFDAHEYHPKEFEDSFKWRLMHQGLNIYLCKKYIPKTDFFTTVCEGISIEYAAKFGKKPEVIRNSVKFQNLFPTPLEEDNIKIIHHGAAISSRKLENIIDVMRSADKRFSLDLMLVGDTQYIESLKKQASDLNNVNFIPPVKQEEIPTFINRYDLGIYILEPTNFNNLNALPNKLFDFIQARIGIVISPNPEMKRLVEKNQIGGVSRDYSASAMADLLNSFDYNTITQYKNASHQIAKEVSAESDIKKINLNVKSLIG